MSSLDGHFPDPKAKDRNKVRAEHEPGSRNDNGAVTKTLPM